MTINMDQLFRKVLYTNGDDLFPYMDIEDHKKLAVVFMDKYILVLLDYLSYRKVNLNHNLDHVIKEVLETINIHRLKSTTLNRLHRGFWNHISLNCRLKEKFIYKWSHKINMLRLKVNKKCRSTSADGLLLTRNFSTKFNSIFPGMENYKPCSVCFKDTSDHWPEVKAFELGYMMEVFMDPDDLNSQRLIYPGEYLCFDCHSSNDDNNDEFDYDYDDYLPSDRHWSEDDSDYGEDDEW